MTPEQKAKYDELRLQVDIDLPRIDHEVARMPGLIQEAAELYIAMTNEEQTAKQAMDITAAEARVSLREELVGGKPKSETRIESEVGLSEVVQAAKDILAAAHYDSQLASSLVGTLREKARLLGKACDMTVAGYITPSSYSGARRTLQQRRQGG